MLEEPIGSLFERIEATARPDSITRQDQLRSDPQIRAATLTIAYEPVWAIGTGKAAQPTDIAEAHQFLHNLFRKRGTGESPRILYGGSVSGNNFGALLAIPHVDGALVGKASLDLASFSELISISERS